MARGFKFISIVVFFSVVSISQLSEAISKEPEQSISDFNLSGFGQNGKKAWEVSGKSADIYSDQIKLTDIVGKIFDEENVTLVAKRGNFDKNNDKIHLENNVVITTDSGVRLTTDYLDWDRQASIVTTEAPVEIQRDNIVTSGLGAKGATSLQKLDLKKDVKLEINPVLNPDKEGSVKNKIVITCEGPLTIDYSKNVAFFNNNVIVDDGESQMNAEQMDVFFEVTSANEDNRQGISFGGKGGRIKKIVARGNVKIVRGQNCSFAEEATYNTDDKTIVLTGRPRLIIYSAPSGE